jgi:hypothetical protein
MNGLFELMSGYSERCMHSVIEHLWAWTTHPENRFMLFLLLGGIAAGLVVLATSAYDAWKVDQPWLGWDLRRRKRRQSSGRRHL